MEHTGRSPRLRVSHSKRTEVYLQNERWRDICQPEVQVHHPGHSVHGVSESTRAGRCSCRSEEVGDLRGELSVSGICEDWNREKDS